MTGGDVARALVASSPGSGRRLRVGLVVTVAATRLGVDVDGVTVSLPMLAGTYSPGDAVLVAWAGDTVGAAYVLGRVGANAAPPPAPVEAPAPVPPAPVVEARRAVILPTTTGTYRGSEWRAVASLHQGDWTDNLVPNPSFTDDIAGWGASGGVTIARSTAQAHEGGASLALTFDGTGSTGAYSAAFPVVPGQTYTLSAYYRSATVARAGLLYLNFRRSDGSWITAAGSGAVQLSTTSWARLSVTVAAPSDAADAYVAPWVENPGAGETHYVDAVQVAPGDTPHAWRGVNTGAAYYGDQLAALGADLARPYSVRVSYQRLPGGEHAAQAPTFWTLTERDRPAGAPGRVASATGAAVAVDAVTTWELPSSWASDLLAGVRGGLAIHSTAASPYIVLAGAGEHAAALALTVDYYA